MAISWDLTNHFFNDSFGQTDVTVSGVVKKGIKFELKSAEAATMAGMNPNVSFYVLFRQSDFTTLPAEGDEHTIGGTVYRVEGEVKKDSRDVTIKVPYSQRY